MKIALITDVIYPFTLGGSELRNYEIAKRLTKKGHEIHIYGAKWWKGPNIINQEGIILHGVYNFPRLYKNGRRTAMDPLFLSIKIAIELFHEKYDIIDNLAFNFFNCYTVKFVTLFKKKTRLVFTWQQYFDNYIIDYLSKFHLGKLKGQMAKKMEQISTALADYNVACSTSVKADLMKNRVNEDKIKVIYNGCSIKQADEAKSLKDKYDLMFLGRLEYQKNPRLFVEVVNILKKDFPNIKAIILGGGSEEQKVLYYISQNNLSRNIIMKGPVRDRKEIYANFKSSKLTVLTSRFEGFPLVIIESYACGTPVISTDYSGGNVTEIIKDEGQIGGQSPIELAKKIKFLLQNNKKRSKLSAECKLIARNFDWDQIANETEEFYNKIIKLEK
jgi:glycosyltransferase involved in cell wall biosynthesis